MRYRLINIDIRASLIAFFSCQETSNPEKRVLVFSKTVDFRQERVQGGIEMIL